ncbi:MAG: adenosylmethionine--8-amino-7-oxononanoate transaminase [Candidatus Firestonebacteria bacterium]
MNNLEQKDKKYIWHPFTQMREYKSFVIEKGKRMWLYDIYGNKYLDGISSLWVNVHGHRKKEIDNAINKQLAKIAHSTLLGIANVPSVELAEKLIKIVPGKLCKVFYSEDGAEAVEIAIKMAYQYWQNKGEKQRTKFLAVKNAYHGDTIGAVSVGGMSLFHSKYKPLLFKTYFATSPYCYRCPNCKSFTNIVGRIPYKVNCNWDCIKKIEKLVKKHKKEICAMIIEPLVQAAAGIIVMPQGYIKKIEQICKENKILLIADEVAVGFGRTGKMFACEYENIKPDLMAVGKGITGGYLPLAVTFATNEIYNAFLGKLEEQKTFYHGHSYTGNPLACASAIANLNIFKKEKTLEKLQPKIKVLSKELEKFKNLPWVGDIRQCGFMAGIELVKNKNTKEPFKITDKISVKICLEARKHRLLIRPLGDVIVIIPPLAIEIPQLRYMLKVIYQAVIKICGKQ